MADEQSGRPLRRWRPFYAVFGAIDGALEAAGHPRAEFEAIRVRIVQLLRGAADDDGLAEQLCAALDDAMAESLETLRVAPVPRGALASTDLVRALAALGGHGSPRIRRLVGDVLRGWKAGVEGDLATTGREAAIEAPKKPFGDRISRQGICSGPVVAAAAAAAEVLETKKKLPLALPAPAPIRKSLPPKKSTHDVPASRANTNPGESKKTPSKNHVPAGCANISESKKTPVGGGAMPSKKSISAAAGRVTTSTSESKKTLPKNHVPAGFANMSESKKTPVGGAIPPKKSIPTGRATTSTSESRKTPAGAIGSCNYEQSEKMEATKRKLHEAYQEAAEKKRQRTTKFIKDKEAPKMFEQKQRKIHPIRARSRAACATSSGARRSLLPYLNKMV